MNITLFLGAGFSAEYGLPVMNTFFDYCLDCRKLDSNDREFLDIIKLESRRANSFLEASPTNLEDILSFSVMGERLGLTDENISTNEITRKILAKVFTNTTTMKNYWNKYNLFKQFLNLELENQKHIIDVITTNYDLSAECSIIRANARANIGIITSRIKEGNVRQVGALYDQAGRIYLHKLHGSVNWFQKDNGEIFSEDRIVKLSPGIDSTEDSEIPYVCAIDYKYDKAPIIIPPSFLKPDFNEPLNKIWENAAHALRNADILIFVGYSFPQSDTEMMYFLARSLVDNARLQKIKIVDPNVNHIIEKINNSNSKFGSHFKQFIIPIKSRWALHKLDYN